MLDLKSNTKIMHNDDDIYYMYILYIAYYNSDRNSCLASYSRFLLKLNECFCDRTSNKNSTYFISRCIIVLVICFKSIVHYNPVLNFIRKQYQNSLIFSKWFRSTY